jgi:diaminopimelate decarboxylase
MLEEIANRLSATTLITRQLSNSTVTVRAAYSVKTNPHPAILKLVADYGLSFECINQSELLHACGNGATAASIVLNGPGKFWPSGYPSDPVFSVAADSISEAIDSIRAINRRQLRCHYYGLRLRLGSPESRFGIPLSTSSQLTRVRDLLLELPRTQKLLAHFHFAESSIGRRKWLDLVGQFVTQVRAVERETDRQCSCVNLGGGFSASCWTAHGRALVKAARTQVMDALKGVRLIVLEPGKAIVQSAMILVSTVLDVRPDRHELVVDASVAELPHSHAFPHHVAWLDASTPRPRWRLLRKGRGTVLGRLCMEHDRLARMIAVPREIQVGDRIAIFDCGAYDYSMSFNFANGSSNPNIQVASYDEPTTQRAQIPDDSRRL